MIGQTIGRKYKVLRQLGKGGMGAVYLAENLDIGRQVAIKILHEHIGKDAASAQRFRQEARASAAIGHPGVVDVLDMGETERGEAFIVMEKLDGQTLAARIAQRGRLSASEAVAIVGDALDAIAVAHAKSIVHRDLKPENLFLVWSPRWCVKVLDFGISRAANADELRITASNTVMGSVLYMPPEQARDARAAGPPADVYALGAVLYHALAGRPPHTGDTYSDVLSRVLTDEPANLAAIDATLPPDLCALVMAMLAKDPATRPNARAAREKLLALVPRSEPPPPPSSPDIGLEDTAPPVADTPEQGSTLATGASLPPVPSPAPRRRWPIAAVVAALAAGGVVLISTRRDDRASVAPPIVDVRVDADAPPDAAIDAAIDASIDAPTDASDTPHDASATKVGGVKTAKDAAVDAPAGPDAFVPPGFQTINGSN